MRERYGEGTVSLAPSDSSSTLLRRITKVLTYLCGVVDFFIQTLRSLRSILSSSPPPTQPHLGQQARPARLPAARCRQRHGPWMRQSSWSMTLVMKGQLMGRERRGRPREFADSKPSFGYNFEFLWTHWRGCCYTTLVCCFAFLT